MKFNFSFPFVWLKLVLGSVFTLWGKNTPKVFFPRLVEGVFPLLGVGGFHVKCRNGRVHGQKQGND